MVTGLATAKEMARDLGSDSVMAKEMDLGSVKVPALDCWRGFADRWA